MKKFPEFVIGTLKTTPKGNEGNLGKVWKLVGEKYICNTPGNCKAELTLEEAQNDLNGGFLKESPFISYAEFKLQESIREKHPLNWIGRWVKK